MRYWTRQALRLVTGGVRLWAMLAGLGLLLTGAAVARPLLMVIVVAVLAWCRLWHHAVLVVTAILGELFAFVLVTATVHRSRPPIPHLDPAPPTSSLPSGHTGAAVAL